MVVAKEDFFNDHSKEQAQKNLISEENFSTDEHQLGLEEKESEKSIERPPRGFQNQILEFEQAYRLCDPVPMPHQWLIDQQISLQALVAPRKRNDYFCDVKTISEILFPGSSEGVGLDDTKSNFQPKKDNN